MPMKGMGSLFQLFVHGQPYAWTTNTMHVPLKLSLLNALYESSKWVSNAWLAGHALSFYFLHMASSMHGQEILCICP